jgi:hypothetical protein
MNASIAMSTDFKFLQTETAICANIFSLYLANQPLKKGGMSSAFSMKLLSKNIKMEDTKYPLSIIVPVVYGSS